MVSVVHALPQADSAEALAGALGAGLEPEHETSRMAAPYARARVTQPLLRLSSGGGLEMR